jgi:hypothetical protein
MKVRYSDGSSCRLLYLFNLTGLFLKAALLKHKPRVGVKRPAETQRDRANLFSLRWKRFLFLPLHLPDMADLPGLAAAKRGDGVCRRVRLLLDVK